MLNILFNETLWTTW